nr:hybrid sensor histidine kinase/response regulator [Kistimonas asteriae]
MYRATPVGGATPGTIIGNQSLYFQPVRVRQLNLAYSDDNIWLRFSLQNPSSDPARVFLESSFSRLDHVNLYAPSPAISLSSNDEYQVVKGGDALPFAHRPFRTRQLTFPIEIPPQTTQTFYIEVQSTSSLHIPLYIAGLKTLIETSEFRYTADGLFYGICLTVILAALLVFLAIRERIYFYYFMHAVFTTAAMMALDGSGFPFWPESLKFQEVSVVVFQCLNSIFVMLFARAYLHLPEYLPRADRVNRIMIWYMLLAMVSSPFLPYSVASFSVVIPEFFLVFWIFGQAMVRSIQGDRPAMIFTAGWTLFISVCVFVAVANLGIVHDYADSIYGLKLAFVSEFFVLMIGLGYRLSLLGREQVRSRELAVIAQAESKAKSEILAKISHEIRTPLNGILGVTELMRQTPLNRLQEKYTDTINDSGQSLLTIINDILDHTRINAGRMELESLSFDLSDLMNRTLNLFQSEARLRNIRLSLEIAPDIPSQVTGDPTRLRQILVNLLGNAFKFTDQGAVSVNVRLDLEDENGQLTLYFSVKDTGIGIPTSLHDRLFQSFVQADAATNRQYGGSGLGLTISKQLAELMGGDIGVISEPGRGSCFWFTVNLSTSMPNEKLSSQLISKPVISPSGKGQRILVAEDNNTNWLVVSEFLKQVGLTPIHARNGKEAVQIYCQQDHQNQPVSMVFMDCEMPGMDGFEATRRIRTYEREHGKQRIPIIALTAHISAAARQGCLDAGMDEHVGKPFNRERILRVIREYLVISEVVAADVVH